MNDADRQALGETMSDNRWAELRVHADSIRRIAGGGRRETQEDDALIRIIANVVSGDLVIRSSQNAEDNPWLAASETRS